MIPKGSRAKEPVFNQDIDDQPHCCGYCGTRTDLDDATHYAAGALNHTCPHCGQRYSLTDEDEEDENGGGDEPVSLDAEGEIEIVDEATGEVVGMTAELPEASQADLDHLFGVKPSPYGDDFGSFG